MNCYENCDEILGKLSDVRIGSTQIHRLTDSYGKAVEKIVHAERTLSPLRSKEVLYVQVDGSMILTREEGWRT
jgi:hypothetical protein